MISMIVATSKNNFIGIDNQLPWYIPDDLKYFKKITNGKTVIMGRKTFESIGRPLPNRRNVVLTRDENYKKDGVEVVHTIQDLSPLLSQSDEIFIIGGGELYKSFLPLADKLYITLVDCIIDGQVKFPEYAKDFIQTTTSPTYVCEKSHLSYQFTVWEKINLK